MEELLKQLLERLEVISEDHGELLDSEVREFLGVAVMDGFVRNQGPQNISGQFGMLSEEANQAVYSAIKDYINEAIKSAELLGLTVFFDRLAALQNGDVVTENRNYYDDFFGHTSPEFYDDNGKVVRTH
jgi:hypothetical protein